MIRLPARHHMCRRTVFHSDNLHPPGLELLDVLQENYDKIRNLNSDENNKHIGLTIDNHKH
jgi:hypothetical protein